MDISPDKIAGNNDQEDTQFSTKRNIEKAGNDGYDNPKSKRPRITFTEEQMSQLTAFFKKDKYPDLFTQRNIAEDLGLTQTNVYNWFQNKRAKEKKQTKSSKPSITLSLPAQAHPSYIPLASTFSSNIPPPYDLPQPAPLATPSTMKYPSLMSWTGSPPIIYPMNPSNVNTAVQFMQPAKTQLPPFNEITFPPL